ncbi:hypothetical protein C8Q79DRAFT_891546, partial [Trametes meyenii]
LNMHTFFETVKTILDRNTETLNSAGPDREKLARSIIVKIVNALSASSEIGGPAVCSYLLGIPDHYTCEVFKVFYWYAYVQFAIDSGAATGMVRPEEPILLGRNDNGVVPLNKVNDYVYRPASFASWTLYDFLRLTDVRKLRSSERYISSSLSALHNGAHQFLQGHPLHATHGVYIRDESEAYVLNFVGQVLPRPDKGDYEQYCTTMLVLFGPSGWRTGRDLLGPHGSYALAFGSSVFDTAHVNVMKNMNVLYECLDARDDYSA